MHRGNRVTIALVVIGAVIIGPAFTASAVPDESQRLRGLEGRTFQVSVTTTQYFDVGIPPFFENCYTFDEGGVYVDPLFPDPAGPVPGEYEQHRVGATTTYTASAVAGPLTFSQSGAVTPAGGNGVLQLTAYAEVSWEGFVLASFESVGFENPDCHADVSRAD